MSCQGSRVDKRDSESPGPANRRAALRCVDPSASHVTLRYVTTTDPQSSGNLMYQVFIPPTLRFSLLPRSNGVVPGLNILPPDLIICDCDLD